MPLNHPSSIKKMVNCEFQLTPRQILSLRILSHDPSLTPISGPLRSSKHCHFVFAEMLHYYPELHVVDKQILFDLMLEATHRRSTPASMRGSRTRPPTSKSLLEREPVMARWKHRSTETKNNLDDLIRVHAVDRHETLKRKQA